MKIKDKIGFRFQWGLSVQRADDAIQTMLHRTPLFYGFMIFHLWVGIVVSHRGRLMLRNGLSDRYKA